MFLKQINNISSSLEEQLNEVFLKRSQNNICGDYRIDVLNKGTLRLVRKVFRHLYTKMFKPKRKRRQQTKLIQFENILNQFKNVWLDQTALIFNEGQASEEFDLIGRLINNQTYTLLPKKYTSVKSEEIMNFITLYNMCCAKYNNGDFQSIINSKFFRFMLTIYENF